MKHIVIGTIGNAQNGKSTLIHALTGTSAEPIPGLEIGTAALKLPDGTMVDIVEVPGQAGGLKSLLTGASAFDLVLLTVSLEEGISPQTAELTAILNLFQIKAGVVALTKADILDRYQAEAAEQAVRARLQETPFAKALFVRVSAKNGRGVDALRRALLSAVSRAEGKNRDLPFRLTLDSVQQKTASEVSIIGTLIAGTLRVGDTVEIVPPKISGRVRSLQVYGQKQKQAEAGSRVTVHLTEIESERGTADVTQGAQAAAPGTLVPTRRFDAILRLPPDAPAPLEDLAAVQVYLGTAEIAGKIYLLDSRERLERGGEAYIQFRSEAAFVCTKGDRFVVSANSPIRTLGGGVLLDAAPTQHSKNEGAALASLAGKAQETPEEELEAQLQKFPMGILKKEIVILAGISDSNVEISLQVLITQGKAEIIAFERVILTTTRKQWTDRANGILAAYHQQFPLRHGIPKEELRTALSSAMDARAFGSLMAQWQADKTFRVEAGLVRRPDFAVQLSERQSALLERITDYYRQCGIETPRMEDVCRTVKAPPDAVNALLRVGVERGELVRAAPDCYYDSQTLTEMQELIRFSVQQTGSLTVALFRDRTKSSRRFALQALEYFDRIRFTLREGDVRILNPDFVGSPAASLTEKNETLCR